MVSQPPIAMVDAFVWFRNEPHQLVAIRDLERKLTTEQIADFSKIYRNEAEAVIIERKFGNLADLVYQCCLDRDYPLATGQDEINIIGIEGINPDGTFNLDQPDRWNDLIGLLSFDNGVPYWKCLYVGTTEPGSYYTKNRLNPNGAARLDTGYHPGLWQVGKHRGYLALVQVGTARLIRDSNGNHRRDDKVTFEKWKGVNFHTTKTTGWRGIFNPNSIGKWSAGCTVIKIPTEYEICMGHILNSAQYKNNPQHLFDFRLIWSRWLNK